MLKIEMNYGTLGYESKVQEFEEHTDALWTLVYWRYQAPFVILHEEGWGVVAEFRFGELDFLDDRFADWAFENTRPYSELRKLFNLKPERA
jgi:hypothetical protein